MLARVSERRLIYVPGMTELRSEFADDAALFYEKLIERRPRRPRPEVDVLLQVHRRGGNTHAVGGRLDRFFEYYDKIIATHRALLAADPTNLYYVGALAGDEMTKGGMLQAAGRMGQAIKLFREALGESERLVHEDPGSADSGFAARPRPDVPGRRLVQIGRSTRKPGAITTRRSTSWTRWSGPLRKNFTIIAAI